MVDLDTDTTTSWRVLFTGCCEGDSLYHENYSAIVHHCCLPWTSRSFHKFTSAFFLSQDVSHYRFLVDMKVSTLLHLFSLDK